MTRLFGTPDSPAPFFACSTRAKQRRWSRIAVYLGCVSASLSVSRAQESIRMSLAGSLAAEARRHAASTLGYYNLKMGPTAWRFGSGLGLDYSTNIRLESTDPKSDFSFIPSVQANMTWPVSDKNSISLDLGGGYQAYTRYSAYNRWFIDPGSQLSFDLYAGDFWFNFHDRFSITTQNYQDPTVVGSADYAQLQNDLGVGTVWDLNKLVMRIGYDHLNYNMLSGSTGQPDGSQEVFSLSGGYVLQQGAEVGLHLGGGLIHYDTTGTNALYSDAVQWNVGPYIDTQVMEYIKLRLSAGYTAYLPDNDQLDNFSGTFLQLDMSHRLNKYLDYTLSGGRSISFALFGGTVDMYTSRLLLNWHILNKINLGTGFTFEHGQQLVTYQENFDRFGPSVGLNRQIMKKMTASLNYQYYNRVSDQPNRSYDANIVDLSVRYQF